MPIKFIELTPFEVRKIRNGNKSKKRVVIGAHAETNLIVPYEINDILLVHESWVESITADSESPYLYQADIQDGSILWKSASSMPSDAIRLALKVTSIKIEHLHEMLNTSQGPGNEFELEGFTYVCDYIGNWENSIRVKDRFRYGWNSNPYVCVFDFEPIYDVSELDIPQDVHRKYELLPGVPFKGKTVYQIRALRSFNFISAGDVGGYVESEANLSHDGYCWVHHNACVHENAFVCDDADVADNAEVCGNAKLSGLALVYDSAIVRGNAQLHDLVRINGSAIVEGDSKLYDSVNVSETIVVSGSSELHGDLKLSGSGHIHDIKIEPDEEERYVEQE